MKHPSRLAIAVLTFIIGILAVAVWSAHIGRKVWSPRVFAWRNPFKPQPIIEAQANCPIRLEHPRFYAFTTIGYSIGSVLKLDAKNMSDKPIHSFTISHHSLEPTDRGSGGWQPEMLLQPWQSLTTSHSFTNSDKITFSIDFVQFANGDVWYADPLRDTVKPEGVEAGAQFAHEFLLKTLESDGATAVMDVLPRIRVYIGGWDISKHKTHGYFGYNCGITNTVVRVE